MEYPLKRKEEIRLQFLDKRNRISPTRQEIWSDKVCEKLHEILDTHKPNNIHSFIPFGSEINILPFLQQCIDLNISLVVPKIKKKPFMQHIQVDNLTDLVVNKFGTKEPLSNKAFEGELNIIIVPGLAFAKNGYRIGYGGGYYDYFLANQKNAKKIAVGFPFQLMEELPHDAHDIPVDMLVLGDQVIDSRNERKLKKN